MKKNISTIVEIIAYLGLPASFIAAAFHQAAPQAAASSSGLLHFLATEQSALVAPLVFATTVMTFALIIVHNLREDQRVADFSNLHLRLSNNRVKSAKITSRSRKPRLATAKVA